MKFRLTHVSLLFAVAAGGIWLFRPAVPADRLAASFTGRPAVPQRMLRPDTDVAIAAVSDHLTPVAKGRNSESLAGLAEFAAWLDRWQSTPAERKAGLEATGVAAAAARRPAMRELIGSDPREVIARAVPAPVRAALPEAVRAHLEESFDQRGDLEVVCSCFGGSHAHGADTRTLVLNGRRHDVAVFGRREGQGTKRGLPVHGIALDGVAALREEPYRRLEAMELRELGFRGERPVVRIGAQVRELAGEAELESLQRALVAAESGPGPFVKGTPEEPARAAAAATAWTTGVKKVLVIRIDFSDLPGEPQGYFDSGDLVPMTSQRVADWIDNRVSPMYQEMSYGATSLVATGTSAVYRMPRTAASYATGSVGDLHQDARTAAAAEHVIAGYDRVVVAFSSLSALSGSNYQFAGIASRNDFHVWINGRFWCVGHELGHTFGLPHANGWTVADSDPLSAGGSSSEYGDPFDIMGGAVNYDARAHFTMWAKNWLGWLADSQVQTVTTNGTYRVQRFDHPSASGTLALKIGRSPTQDIWIGLRRNFTDNASLSHGAYVLWGGVTDVASNLLDLTTPGAGFSDAVLGLGRSFSDPLAGVTVKTLGEGGTAPAEYLDVEVTFGPAAPSLYVAPAPAVAGAGLAAVFNVSASGIPAVVYQWQRRPAGAASWMNVTESDTFTGGATNTLIVKSVVLALAGDEFRCVVANSAGRLTTNPSATLAVLTTGVTTVAGRAGVLRQRDGIGPLAMFKRPSALAHGPEGTFYVTEHLGGLRQVSPSGEVTTLVATLPEPLGVAVGADGTVYVSSASRHTISKVSPAGAVTLWAGASGIAGSADGPVAAARFNGPKGLALDPAGNLYVADFANRTIRRITPEGNVTTLAGAAGQQGSADGVGVNARFSYPEAVTVDPWGTLYVADWGTIRRIAPDLQVTTLPDPESKLNLPYKLTADAFGNLWVADWVNCAVYRFKPDRSIAIVSGAVRQPGSADGAPDQARFFHPNGLVRDAAGALLVADADNNTIRRIVVPGLPQIDAPPADQVVAAGQPLTLAVAAANSAGYLYQWFKDGVPLSGATQAALTRPAAQAADGGSYVVMIGNGEGSVTSRRARVTVGGAILAPPASRTVYAGQPVEFSVGAIGVGDLLYQWTKDGINLPGATAATLRLAEAGPAAAGRYAVTVSFAGGSIASGGADLVVRSPVVAWTGATIGTLAEVPPDLGDGRQIAAGFEHALALRTDGTVATWGSTRAALTVPAGLTGVTAIAASAYGPVSGAVKNDGSVVLWGDTRYYGPLTVPAGLDNVRQIALAETGFLALRADGTVFTHTFGQTTIQAGPAELTGVVAIARGRSHNVALKSDGTVVAWGGFIPPAPGGLSSVVAIAAGAYFAVALKSDGTVVAWGDANNARDGEVNVPPWLTGVRAIAATYYYTMALKSDGRVVLWGKGIVPTAPTSMPAGFPRELTAISISAARSLALVGKGPFVSLPPLRVTVPGGNNTLTASVTGAGAFSLQWLKNGSPIPGATAPTLAFNGGQAAEAGAYQVAVTGPGGSVISDPSTVVPVSFSQSHAGSGYRTGGLMTFHNAVTFAGTLSALKWAVLLPAGWSLAGARGSEGEVKPTADSTDLIDWAWTTPPSSPVNFSYDLRVPAGTTGRQEIVALVTVNAGGTPFDFVVRPDPLYVAPALDHHSADTNRDLRLGLTELTRVIELYNTRNGTTRTGAYRVELDTEDGFAPEPGQTGGTSVVLPVYHLADADRDARLSLVELTRVIELYNYRSGTVRTGQYRVQDTSEDGFAPGP